MSAPGDKSYEFHFADYQESTNPAFDYYFAQINDRLILMDESKLNEEGCKMAERFVTPKAKCLWANLQEPNVSDDETIADAFQIVLVLGDEYKPHKELIDQICSLYADAGGKKEKGEKGHPVKFHENSEKQRVPGWYQVRFKSLAQYVDHIPTFDAKGAKILREKNFVANESVVRVSWSFKYYNTAGNKGVSLFLLGVQVLELIEWQGYSAEQLGFSEQEGYEEYGGAVSQKIAENENGVDPTYEAAKAATDNPHGPGKHEGKGEDDLPF